MPAEAPPRRLRVAAVQNDDSPAWQSFYPEDLPADWKLAYYVHFWRDLLVPAEDWAAWVEAPHRVDEVPEELRLYFRVPEPAQGDCAALVARLGARLGGLLFPEPGAGVPVQLPPAQAFRRLPDPVLDGVRSAQAFANADATVLVLEPESGLDLRQWRALLEVLSAASAPGCETLVFLQASPGELEQAQAILRLSGLAWRQG